MGSHGEVKSFTEVAGGVWHFYEAGTIVEEKEAGVFPLELQVQKDQLVSFYPTSKNSGSIRCQTV